MSNKTTLRPMNVAIRANSPAAERFRVRHSQAATQPVGQSVFPPTPEHDLIFHGGKTIANLSFMNCYVGGSEAWNPSDIQNIDQSLSAAMSDANLNNVMVQYFPQGTIVSSFLGSVIMAGPAPNVVSQGDTEALVQAMFDGGMLAKFDLASTVFNLMLPSGTILNADPAPTTSALRSVVQKNMLSMEMPTAIPTADEGDSKSGLGGYHGSVHVQPGSATDTIVYYAVGVFSEVLADGTQNGIPVFDQPWKNVVGTFYHELNEARTDADVEDAISAGDDPSAAGFLGWTSAQGEECGDFPVFESSSDLTAVFQEVPLADGSGTVPVQFQYSNAVHGPEAPVASPEAFQGMAAPAPMASMAAGSRK